MRFTSIALAVAAVLVTNTAAVSASTLAVWEFNDGSGAAAMDSSGNGRHGTLAGSSLPTWGAGQLLFAQNTGNRVETPVSWTELKDNDFIIDLTFTYTGAASDSYRALIASSFGPSYSGSEIFYIGKNGGNANLNVNIGNLKGPGSNASLNLGGTDLFDGNEHTLSVRFDDTANTMTFFKDGSATPFHTLTDLNGVLGSTSNVWIGTTGHAAAGEAWQGSISRVAISVPEPASLSLLALACLGFLSWRRRR
jgi:hypothetical protein